MEFWPQTNNEYERWRNANLRTGYVLNMFRYPPAHPAPKDYMVHHADCFQVGRENPIEGASVKCVSVNEADLVRVTAEKVGFEPGHCKFCMGN